MSTKQTQILGVLSPDPKTYEIRRELEHLHKTLNDRLVATAQTDLSVVYTAADLGTAADIATALNLTNTRINAILAKIRTGG